MDVIDVEAIARLAAEVGCTLHHTPGKHLIVMENGWPDEGKESPNVKRKPYLVAFADTPAGYGAAIAELTEHFHTAILMLHCDVCGEDKDTRQFDSRFLAKNVRHVCQDCRDNPQTKPSTRPKFEAKRSEYMERYPEHADRFRWENSYKGLEEVAERIETRVYEVRDDDSWYVTLDEQTAAHYQAEFPLSYDWLRYSHDRTEFDQRVHTLNFEMPQWCADCATKVFDEDDQRHIAGVHYWLRHIRNHGDGSWAELKSAFLNLNPPYLGVISRPSLAPVVRAAVYEHYQGICAYCGVHVLPLGYYRLRGKRVHYTELPDAATYDGPKSDDGYVIVDKDKLPCIDHKIPVSRGGDDTRENLTLACHKCNARKGYRTAEEFAAFPNDALSQLHRHERLIFDALLLEQRGYDRFGDETAERAAEALYERLRSEQRAEQVGREGGEDDGDGGSDK